VKARHLVRLRRTLQTLFLLFFFFLLIESRLPQDIYVDYSLAFSPDQDLRLDQPVSFFLQLDPLVGISSLLSGCSIIKGFLWGAGVLVLTILIGRAFCGFICPFGTIHHAVAWFKPALKGIRMVVANRKTSSQKIKYFVLVLVLVSAIVGLNSCGLMDPIALLFRSVALAVLPGLGAGLRSFFDALAAGDIKILNLAGYGAEVLVSPIFGYNPQAYQTAWFMGLIFLVILFLNIDLLL